MDEHLSQIIRMESGITPSIGGAGTTPVNGTVIDTQGFDGCMMIFYFGAIVGGAVISIKAQCGQQANLSDAADLAGTAQSVADTDDDKIFYIDIYRPPERYVRGVVNRATQNATIGSMIYLLYGGRTKPVAAQGSGVSGERFVDGTEGTA